MTKTGQKFDINPETFTLANIFAMELQRYQETIGEIVTMASKEMGIEKVRAFIWHYDLICFFNHLLDTGTVIRENIVSANFMKLYSIASFRIGALLFVSICHYAYWYCTVIC